MLMRRDVERITADRARRWGLEGRERARPARGRPSRAYPRRPPVTQGEATARSRREQPAGAEASHDATKPWPAVDDVGKAGPGRRRRLNGGPPEFPCEGLPAQASLNRSSTGSLARPSNLAIAHSREGSTTPSPQAQHEYRSFRTLSSVGKCPGARTARRKPRFKGLDRVRGRHDALGVGAAGEDRLIFAYGATIRAAGPGSMKRGQADAFDELRARVTDLLTSHLTVPAPSLSRQRVGHIPRRLVVAGRPCDPPGCAASADP